MNRHTAVLLPAAGLLTLTGFAAPAQADDGQLRPGATLAPPVIADLRLVTAVITTVSGTVDDRREDTTGQTTVTLGARILFGKDSATLTAAARTRIRAVAGEIRSWHATKATIVGYTDDLGSAAHGLTLSRRRAEACATSSATNSVPASPTPSTDSATPIRSPTTRPSPAGRRTGASPSPSPDNPEPTE
ncbi:OmpA family protein [Streptomyces sp. NPDC057445]|uniref:OmpA family protein n=1 Tax=Streptomyces sp. NPDC057445 TaxID=3346136 RepID=UPI003685EF4D